MLSITCMDLVKQAPPTLKPAREQCLWTGGSSRQRWRQHREMLMVIEDAQSYRRV
jgi:hypothetical protein